MREGRVRGGQSGEEVGRGQWGTKGGNEGRRMVGWARWEESGRWGRREKEEQMGRREGEREIGVENLSL